jgi:hypothetical protein
MSDVKHTVYLPADFVRQLQERALADWRPANGVATVLVEVPAAERVFYESLVRYLAHRGTPAEEEWKAGLRRVVAAFVRATQH